MKAIIFLALLGLTLQMHLIHDQTDIQRAYVISANNLNNDKINGLTVKFDKGRISFKGCNNNIASY